ncbi:MAG: Histidine kinase [uncultured Campylobacterales bacterium]|uniref:Histidine kinase n=1 Tax=uncultured Campylobacterales bacterium TaxID=352960 RepID=A0A6S6T2P3_9BACT|nr:MAG: Histidine kinase [uncultured Campylobacterales bacterium]
MLNKFQKKYFKTNVLIKNIIGKELINDDNVAVMELVKNSYDAGASTVTIEFQNLFNKSKKAKLIIQDDGVGMSEDDILNKWLNIAYSAKKLEHTQNERYQAGNKGVGRFSCDRLGESLDIYTRKEKQSIIHLKINWKDFELLDEIDTQIQDVAVYIREIEDTKFKIETGFDIFSYGTILQIEQLNNIWADIESENKFFTDLDIDSSRLLKLKSSLERLINPNQSYSRNSFKIYIKANELKEDKGLPYHEKVTGEIKNQIFDKLDFKTTFIESYISKDGSKIVTELKDKNKIIFRLIEKNREFPLLKDIKITIYYLNPYAKGFFTKQTGVKSVEFGSIFLFINGFRVPPYGDRENDALGLEVRKNQGRSRYFGNREILGRIEVKDFDNKFRVISSREGIVHNNYYKQLIRDSERKNGKYSGYFYTTLKRIEKYVVDGLNWDSLPEELNESTIQKEIVDGTWDSSTEIYKIDDRKKLTNSSEIIKQMLAIKNQDVLDLYINDELIENLIEKDKEKTEKKLQDFLKNFGSISLESFDKKTQNALKKLTSNIKDEKIVQLYQDVLSKKQKVEEELDEEKKSKEELYSLYKKRVREEKKKAKIQKDKLVRELEDTKKEKTFFQRLNTSDKQQVLELHHSIGTSTVTINNHLGSIQKKIKSGEAIDKNYLEKTIKQISFVNNKIASIANFATKASWDAESEDIKNDIVKYIEEYISNVCMIGLKTMDHQDLIILLENSIKDEVILTFQPIKIAMLFDNLISNSRKAKSTQINIKLIIIDNELEIEYFDDGKGIKEDIEGKIFNLGFSTTSGGAGMGMSHIRKILQELNDSIIKLDNSFRNGAKFIIRIKNET